MASAGAAIALFILMPLPLMQSFNVTSYLTKYQMQPEVEGNKVPFLCHNGGRVVHGRADFSAFPLGDDGRPLSFLEEASRQSFHCACPKGFTGLRCDRHYQFCSITASSPRAGNSSLHVCFNNGRCIDGQEATHSEDKQFCDCSEATFRGKSYTGKYCEKTTPELQACNQEGSKFCVHGECNDESSQGIADHLACICYDGFVGEHCNFQASEEPSCDLDCGPGTCRITYGHYDDANDYYQYWQHNVNHTYCNCPPGHTGTTCEISAKTLASGSGSVDICDGSMKYFCLNGGVCKSNYLKSQERPCSCPVGFDGPHCEFKEGEVPDCTLDCQNGGVCTIGIQSIQEVSIYAQFWQRSVNNMYCDCPEGHHGFHCEVDLTDIQSSKCGELSNELFCFSGVCERDRTSNKPRCHCKRGYVGESCQFKQNQVPDCNLTCQHGQCLLGVKTLGDKNDINRFWETHVNFTYCRCDEGWYGMTCEIPSKQCGDNVCLGNGTKCAVTARGEGYCDCTSARKSNDPLSLAGEHCQYEAMSICQTATESYFCYNTGVCSSTSPGCDCPDGFAGPVCEYEETRAPTCSLECQNGGVCKRGIKYTANVTQKAELDFLRAFSNDNYALEHCMCKEGFAGNRCETKVEVCGDDNHICLHGSECLEEEDGSYSCDCKTAFTVESRYAGKFCQHHHTDVCSLSGQLLFSGSAADMHFCVNDGVCRKSGSPGYPGCDCGPLYFGSRCEFSRLYDNAMPKEDADSPFRVGTWASLFSFVIFTLSALIAWRRRQKNREMAEIIEESKRWAEESLSPFAPTPSPSLSVADDAEWFSPEQTPHPRLDSVEII